MKIRKIGFCLAALGLVSALSNPVLAGPVVMKQVRQVLKGDYQQRGDNASLELRLAGEGDEKKKPAAPSPQDPANAGPTAEQDPKRMPQQNTETKEDVTVENCNCDPNLPLEEIPPVKGGGFPKWIFGLGAIPLVCLTGICTKDNPPPPTNVVPTPNVTPTPPGGGPGPTPEPPIPEPTTILLFGSGLMALGAAARRRRKADASIQHEGERDNEQ
jgi:hypothetical protein